MKKHVIIAVSVAFALTVVWTAFGQPAQPAQQPGQEQDQRGGAFARMREAQTKAITTMQDELGKLKALMEQAPQFTPGQRPSEEEMTKMRERRAEQQKLVDSIQMELDKLKGARTMMMEHNESMTALKDIQASAEKENAKETAKKVGDMIAQRQKQFEDKMAAMGYTPEQMQRFEQMGRGRPQQ
jgi:hypothetical protein